MQENKDKLKLQCLTFVNDKDIECINDIENLASIFYSEFYNKPKNPYNKVISGRIDEKIISQLEKPENSNIKIFKEHPYWLYCSVNKGVEKFDVSGKGTKMGRIYLNIIPEKIPELFEKIAENTQKEGLNIEIKTTKNYSDASERIDKLIIYFSEKDSEKILEIIDKIYKENNIYFIQEIPKFTAQLKTGEGERMNGVSFGEEPIFWGESFGTIRAKILGEIIYINVKKTGDYLLNQNFDLKSDFVEMCKKYSIDPNNPAFNSDSLENNKFLKIRERIID
ncbi:MAG: T3SS effector HopA1 family protein [candidate division WOR-3 bacterium]